MIFADLISRCTTENELHCHWNNFSVNQKSVINYISMSPVSDTMPVQNNLMNTASNEAKSANKRKRCVQFFISTSSFTEGGKKRPGLIILTCAAKGVCQQTRPSSRVAADAHWTWLHTSRSKMLKVTHTDAVWRDATLKKVPYSNLNPFLCHIAASFLLLNGGFQHETVHFLSEK